MECFFTDRQKLWASALIVVSVTLGMGAMLIRPHHADYRDSQMRLQALGTFRAALDLGQAVSAERGPANSAMGEPSGDDAAVQARLREFRDRSDARYDQLRAAIDREPWRDRAGWLAQLERSRLQLGLVRTQVDRIAAQPPAARDPLAVAGTVDHAFRIVDGLQPMITVTGTRLTALAPATSGNVILARVLFDAREYGGRLGSLVMPSVVTRTPLPAGSQAALEQMRGRLGALQEVILHGDLADLDGNEFVDESHQVASGTVRSMQEGARIMDRLLEQGAGTGHYPLTARTLTDAYVPTLRPLEEARSGLLNVIEARLRQERDEARQILGWTLAGLAAVLGVVLATLWLALRRLFAPLLAASRELVALAGHPAPAPDGPRPRSEIGMLQDALRALRGRLQERDLLDRKRQADGEQLRRAAETDALTGLANRRVLFRSGENPGGGRRARDLGASLVLFDVDHFKRINDRHGHPAGDQVLRAVAAVAAANVRAGDLLARFGGEEFAVLVPDPDEGRAAALAEKMRAALAEAEHLLPDGERLQVTASFGVASGQRGALGWLDLIDRADRALYQAKQRGRDRVCADGQLGREA
ncbi:MAG: GGDEF domain-containing protein [Xylophilus ampelinus]